MEGLLWSGMRRNADRQALEGEGRVEMEGGSGGGSGNKIDWSILMT